MPIRMPNKVGKPYRPSNGTEGDIFMDTYCEKCTHDDIDNNGDFCEIIALSMGYDTDDPEYPKEWVFNKDSYPICTKFEGV